MICRKFETEFKKMRADLLFEPERVPDSVRTHIQGCADCSRELDSLKGAMQALDAWEDITPSPFFNARMSARLREARAEQPASLVERLRARLLFSFNMQLRTVAAGALAAVVLIGGGTYAGVKGMHRPDPQVASATVRDLQSMQENAQVFQEMSSLDEDTGATGSGIAMTGSN